MGSRWQVGQRCGLGVLILLLPLLAGCPVVLVGAGAGAGAGAVKVEPTGKETTTVKIRIGTFGDQAASESIQARVASSLRR